jgi:hypothetical protein
MPENAIRAGRLLQIHNLSQVQNAFGALTFIDDIRHTRNAIVHSIPACYGKFRSMTLSKYYLRNIDPSFLPLERNPSSGNTIYEDWCNELLGALRRAM